MKNNIISVYKYYKKSSYLLFIHSEMKNEVVTLLKAIGVVVVGVLLANAVERKLLSSKVDAPMQVPQPK